MALTMAVAAEAAAALGTARVVYRATQVVRCCCWLLLSWLKESPWAILKYTLYLLRGAIQRRTQHSLMVEFKVVMPAFRSQMRASGGGSYVNVIPPRIDINVPPSIAIWSYRFVTYAIPWPFDDSRRGERRRGRRAAILGKSGGVHLRVGGSGEQLRDGPQSLYFDDQRGVREGIHGPGFDDGGLLRPDEGSGLKLPLGLVPVPPPLACFVWLLPSLRSSYLSMEPPTSFGLSQRRFAPGRPCSMVRSFHVCLV